MNMTCKECKYFHFSQKAKRTANNYGFCEEKKEKNESDRLGLRKPCTKACYNFVGK